MNSSTSAAAPESPSQADLAAVDTGPQLNITVWGLTGVATAFFAVRLYCKLLRKRRLRWDDWVLAAGWSACVHYGLGLHGRFIKPENLDNLLFYSYAAGFASTLAAAWTKSSFAITLLSISDGRTRHVVWFVLISVNVVLGLNATLQWVQCWPPGRQWHPGAPGTCWLGSQHSRAYNIFVAAYSGCADMVLAVVPWKILWHMKMRQAEKVAVLFVMSMGVFAGITSFLKIMSLDAIGNVDLITTVNLFIFGTAEGAITIMAASIPIVRALLYSDARQ
ncbi:hypothetical protein SPBR_01856 [Sporothrix brasiliensis 5110]|uniref:Rhodopsin domain-containing protein n=1 Tax=Sporothrix brasiliensis 5110 TaxID=1398154 RepID=A0A0C2J2C5_9PEZI|nr:uncharacterized protein SPBR_01856 [Sporothrix brasiliensis 5110]KIH91227.1 hypothetical protein SPBR_01856 [Sporothrix brasiliensis 5110]